VSRFVWLFAEHRDLQEKYNVLLRLHEVRASEVERLLDKNERLTEDNKKLAESLIQAQAYIQSNPNYINSVMDLMEKYQREVLQELPLPQGQEPEWLTPGEDLPPVKDDQ
jgi:hypothetical protein